MKEKIKIFFLADWTLPEKCLLLADVLLTGILIGWLTSPLKNGFHFFSDNDMNNNNSMDYKEEK